MTVREVGTLWHH